MIANVAPKSGSSILLISTMRFKEPNQPPPAWIVTLLTATTPHRHAFAADPPIVGLDFIDHDDRRSGVLVQHLAQKFGNP